MNTFGAKIRLLRKQKDLSQDEVAKRIGYSRIQVSNWEIGRSEPDVLAINKLATLYFVTTDYLLGKVSTPDATLSSPQPQEQSGKKTEKQRDLDEFLQQPGIMFKGIPLSNDAIDGVRKILNEIYGMAKAMNKRKK